MRQATQPVAIPVNHLIISPQFLGTPVFSPFTQTRFLLLSFTASAAIQQFSIQAFLCLAWFCYGKYLARADHGQRMSDY